MVPIILIVGLILLVAGLIYLQIFLSKKESKWLGLILPIINFSLALFVVFVSVFSYSANISFTEVKDGEIVTIVEENTENTEEESKDSALFAAIIIFFYCNISTIILLMIYFICRKSINKKKTLDMMTVQDLE